MNNTFPCSGLIKIEKNMKTTASILIVLSAIISYGTEWIKNGDFENGQIKPWFLSTKNSNAKLSIITDTESPLGDRAVLGITVEKEPRVTIRQGLKVKPGIYKFTAYMDTTRCTKPAGYAFIYFDGKINGKWKNFGGAMTPGTPKTPGLRWQKTKWAKYEKIINVPPDGKIENVYIVLSHITGTVMVDGISLRNYDGEKKELEKIGQKQLSDKKKLKIEEDRADLQGIFQSRKYRNLFSCKETPELGFELKTAANREISVRVRFTTKDYFGRTILKSEKEFKVPTRGKTVEILRYPECRQPGFYCTNAEWKSGRYSGSASSGG